LGKACIVVTVVAGGRDEDVRFTVCVATVLDDFVVDAGDDVGFD
jgi:hypothetical protein